MCGLIGFFGRSSVPEAAIRQALQRMRPRGPDGEGLWREPGVALGHRRLAVLDLDQRAAQPMHSACGRYVIIFNGEIYNFRELRRELEAGGGAFRTTSDTEVLLALFAAEGEAMLPRLRGMFAFLIWDQARSRGFAARDPYGIKPLYYAQTPQALLLASQVKALLATGLVSRDPDARGQAGFWMLGSVPEPHTWYRHIRALPPGHYAWIEDGRLGSPTCWRDIGAAWHLPVGGTLPAPEVRNHVRSALRAAVAAHLVADVPVGVFLSGGIDSGSLAGLMVEAGARDLQGVTLAFREFAGRAEDEAPVAARVAAHYGIAHHVRVVTREEFEADLPRILHAMDQPSIDGINTWYASKAAAEIGLKVVVSGVGGDELFQGYSHFRQLPRVLRWRRWLGRVPGTNTALAAAGRLQARRSGNSRWRHLAEWTKTMEGAWWMRRSVCALEDLPALMGDELAREALRDFDVVAWVQAMTGPLPPDPVLALGQVESMCYLRNQLLRDSDWASMDHSVELRTPLVDAWLLRDTQALLPMFSTFRNKALLADAPAKPLPRALMKRRKTGFGIPVWRWLAESRQGGTAVGARDWARELAGWYQTSAQ